MSHPTVRDLLEIAGRPKMKTTVAVARALGINWAQAAELKRLALRSPAPKLPPPRIAAVMHRLGINRAEAEAYIRLQFNGS